MSSAEFARFTEAVAAHGRDTRASPTARLFERVAVLGGAPDARIIAALCLAKGATVTLFSTSGGELDELAKSGGVTTRGEGPVGTFQFNRKDAPSITTTAHLDMAVDAADLIFLTGPIHAQRLSAMLLAGRLRDGQVVTLVPGRSFGALEARRLLRVGGCQAEITLIECQNPPFWYQQQGATLHLSACGETAAATVPHGKADVIEGLKVFFPHIVDVGSVLHSSFADGSGLVEAPALLLGGPATPGGQPRVPAEAEALAENDTFRHLIGDRHLDIIKALAAERRAVASCFGVRDLPGTEQWINAHAGAPSDSNSRPIPDHAEAQRMLRCAAIGSLIPLANLARIAALDTPLTRSMIALVTAFAGGLADAGRSLESMGVASSSLDDSRRALDAMARG